jgi:hypothetical protein
MRPLHPAQQAVSQALSPSLAKAASVVTLTPYYGDEPHPLAGHQKAPYVAAKTVLNLVPVVGGAFLGAKAMAMFGPEVNPVAVERVFTLAGLGLVAAKEWLELLANPSQRKLLGGWMQQTGTQKPGEKLLGFIPRREKHILEGDTRWHRQGYMGLKGLGYLVPFAIATKIAWPLGAGIALPAGVLSGLGTDGLREWITMGWNKNQRRLVGEWLLQAK